MEWPFNPGPAIARDYRICRFLGAGRWGEVWLVEHCATGFHYAVKRLNSEDPHATESHFRELALWKSKEESPYIVSCYFWRNCPDGSLLIFSQYIRGGALATWLDRGRYTSFKRVLIAAIQLMDALSFAHRNLLKHGDISPNNIMVGPGGRLMLTDFGQGADWQLDSISDIGTPAYSSGMPSVLPSPATGEDTDLWSAGLVLLHLMLGYRFWTVGTFGEMIVDRAQEHLQRHRGGKQWMDLLSIVKRCFVARVDSAHHTGMRLRRLADRNHIQNLPVAPPSNAFGREVWRVVNVATLGALQLGHRVVVQGLRMAGVIGPRTTQWQYDYVAALLHYENFRRMKTIDDTTLQSIPQKLETLHVAAQMYQETSDYEAAFRHYREMDVLAQRWQLRLPGIVSFRIMALAEMAEIRWRTEGASRKVRQMYYQSLSLATEHQRTHASGDHATTLIQILFRGAAMMKRIRSGHESRRLIRQAAPHIFPMTWRATNTEIKRAANFYDSLGETFKRASWPQRVCFKKALFYYRILLWRGDEGAGGDIGSIAAELVMGTEIPQQDFVRFRKLVRHARQRLCNSNQFHDYQRIVAAHLRAREAWIAIQMSDLAQAHAHLAAAHAILHDSVCKAGLNSLLGDLKEVSGSLFEVLANLGKWPEAIRYGEDVLRQHAHLQSVSRRHKPDEVQLKFERQLMTAKDMYAQKRAQAVPSEYQDGR